MNEPDKKETVLIVDDTQQHLNLMRTLLKDHFDVRLAGSGPEAIALASSGEPPDLIILDIMMPEMSGYEVCRRLKADLRTADIPVVFLTAKSEVEDEKLGLELGALDYITKPISPRVVLARVKNYMLMKRAGDFLKDNNAFLEREIARRTKEIGIVRDVMIMALASLAETRDNETGNHIKRTQNYIRVLVERLKTHPNFREKLNDDGTNELFIKSAPLHDIGKVGIPDRILLKPGRLTPDEFTIMKTHTTIGRDAILSAEKPLKSPSSFLRIAREIAYSHHERWDGTGYPRGLKGNAIPLPARLMALADVYDALISHRVYKPPYPHEKAVSEIVEAKGTQFDPEIVDAFVEVNDRMHAVAVEYADSEETVNSVFLLKNSFL